MNEGTPIIIKKKKGHGEHGHHGGSWKVAYADFVTAMMAFFMVMWIMGLSDSTRAQIQGYFNDPIGFDKTMQKSRAVINVNPVPPQGKKDTDITKEMSQEDRKDVSDIQKKFDRALESSDDNSIKDLVKQVETTITNEGLQIEFVENTGAVFFESGSAVIRPEAAKLFAKVAAVLGKSGRKMIIEGHTDSTPYPSASYTNWDLSSDRALALRKLLVADGVSDKQVLQVRGYADTKLKRPDDPTHFSNRRVTVLLPFRDITDPMLDLPKEEFEHERQGVFRQPVNVAPDTPDLTSSSKSHPTAK